MLNRAIDGGYLLFTQPAHAWVSGQLAAAWGNEQFGEVSPRQEVCLAAEQHDIGWLEWEANPTWNPETGLPRTFMELPTLEHVSVWEPAGPRSLVYGPYVALLVSMHGTGLYQYHNFERDNAKEAAAARNFMDTGAEFERGLIAQMKTDDRYRSFVDERTIARNSRIVAICDAISLMLCGGLKGQREFNDVPTAGDRVTVTLAAIAEGSDRYSVDPWPFQEDSMTLVCAARWIESTFSSEASMREQLATAPWRRIEFHLEKT